jgi:hypothetical protein
MPFLGRCPRHGLLQLKDWNKRIRENEDGDTQHRFLPVNEDPKRQTIREQFYSEWHAHCVRRPDGEKSAEQLSEKEIDIMADLIQMVVK